MYMYWNYHNKPSIENILTYEDCQLAYNHYLKVTGKAPISVSGWDVDKNVHLPYSILNKTLSSIEKDINTYYLVEEDIGNTIISDYVFSHVGISIHPKNILIGGSATALLSLVLLALTAQGAQPLVLEPSYYTVHDILTLINQRYLSIPISFPDLTYDYDAIERAIKEENIRIIVLTDPIWGSGIAIGQNNYLKIVSIANKYQCTLIADLARMGLQWDGPDEPLLGEYLDCICKSERYAVVYSPCKKLFANGVKTGVLISSENVMQQIHGYSDSFLGSISAAQASFLTCLFSKESSAYASSQIIKNSRLAKEHYDILNTLLYSTEWILLCPQMGHYALTALPSNGVSERDMFSQILNSAGVFTMPMGLYGIRCDSHYWFRVNLLMNLDSLIDAMEHILLL